MTRDWLNLRPPPLIFLGSSLMSSCQKYRERKGLRRAFLVDFKFPCQELPPRNRQGQKKDRLASSSCSVLKCSDKRGQGLHNYLGLTNSQTYFGSGEMPSFLPPFPLSLPRLFSHQTGKEGRLTDGEGARRSFLLLCRLEEEF